jgi:hypothetical protein
MKKIILLLLISYSGFAQSWVFYKPNGEITSTEGTIKNNVEKIYGENYLFHSFTPKNPETYRIKQEEGIYSVIFQIFTNKPILLLGGKINDSDIKNAIAEFNLDAYFKNSEFTYTLKKLIKENKLTEELIYKSFGKPNNLTSTSSTTFLHYNKPNITFMIQNGFAIEYTLLN